MLKSAKVVDKIVNITKYKNSKKIHNFVCAQLERDPNEFWDRWKGGDQDLDRKYQQILWGILAECAVYQSLKSSHEISPPDLTLYDERGHVAPDIIIDGKKVSVKCCLQKFLFQGQQIPFSPDLQPKSLERPQPSWLIQKHEIKKEYDSLILCYKNDEDSIKICYNIKDYAEISSILYYSSFVRSCLAIWDEDIVNE